MIDLEVMFENMLKDKFPVITEESRKDESTKEMLWLLWAMFYKANKEK